MSIFTPLVDAFKYLFQSAKGKYSLETYLDILSEFTDEVILDAKKENLSYIGGKAVFSINEKSNTVNIKMELEFKKPDRNWVVKKAERNLDMSDFTEESLLKIKSMGEMVFQINSPDEVE